MSGGVVAVSAEDDVELAARIMEQHQIRRLPVLDRSKLLVGIVSLGDIATSSNPAFSGIALRDVSEPNDPNARHRRLASQSEPVRMPAVPGARRGPAGNGRRTAGARGGSQTRAARKSEQKKGRSGGRRSAAKAARSTPTTAKKSPRRSRRARG
jgi:hypothetical protein